MRQIKVLKLKWQQKQSIPDQINACIQYAENNNLSIAQKPSRPWFETKIDIQKEDNEENHIANIYQESRNLYIIKEQKSAKEHGARPKWKKLIEEIKKWKIKWIIFYHQIDRLKIW